MTAPKDRTIHPREAYADSYAQMARHGDGLVDCRSVEVDIRQNMIPATQAPQAAETRQKFHRDVLAAHVQFGGDLPTMQAAYDRPDHIARIAALETANETLKMQRETAVFMYDAKCLELAQTRRKALEEGIEQAAKFVEARLDDYVKEHGMYDHETGFTEFPGDGQEYAGELEEILEGIRALINKVTV